MKELDPEYVMEEGAEDIRLAIDALNRTLKLLLQKTLPAPKINVAQPVVNVSPTPIEIHNQTEKDTAFSVEVTERDYNGLIKELVIRPLR